MLAKGELLDRMEILYPYEPRFSDLRRAYIDRDMSSLFRLFANDYGDQANELRKAVMESNLHSIFRIFEGGFDLQHRDANADLELTDLRKFILEDNVWSLYRLLLDTHDTQIVRAIKSMHAANIRWDKDAMSQGQLKSKMWLIDELKALDVKLGTVFLCAGWYGILATLLFEHGFDITCIRSFDIDPDVRQVAEKFNLPWVQDDWKFKSVVADIHSLHYSNFNYSVTRSNGSDIVLQASADTIINTSCEHIDNFDEWYDKIPSGKLVILQSNDYDEVEEHINLSPSLQDFAVKTPIEEVLYSGVLNLSAYNRFMRIGYK